MVFYDFDDIGVPENADKKWRQETTEAWIKLLLSLDGWSSLANAQLIDTTNK